MTDSKQRHHEYVIDKICPRRQIHLIGGPSGANKTTLVFQMFQDLSKGVDIFGYKSTPEPYIYVATDRDDEETLRTLDRMGIVPDFPYVGLSDKREWMDRATRESKPEYVVVLEELRKGWPQCKSIIWDGFSFMVAGDQNKTGDVAIFLRRLHSYVKALDLTVFGIVNAAKQREDNRIQNPRQRISGSAAWAHIGNCVFIIEPKDMENPEDERRDVWVCPRNARNQHFDMQMTDQGVLAFVDPPAVEGSSTWYSPAVDAIRGFSGDEMGRSWLVDNVGVPEGTVDRLIRELCVAGVLTKVSRGTYRTVRPS